MSIPFVIDLTDESFEREVIESPTPVLVDFYTAWCPPCKALAPVIESLSQDFAGRVKVCKLDAEANPRSAMRFGIRGVPTVIIFKSGQPVATMSGYQAKQRFTTELNRIAG